MEGRRVRQRELPRRKGEVEDVDVERKFLEKLIIHSRARQRASRVSI